MKHTVLSEHLKQILQRSCSKHLLHHPHNDFHDSPFFSRYYLIFDIGCVFWGWKMNLKLSRCPSDCITKSMGTVSPHTHLKVSHSAVCLYERIMWESAVHLENVSNTSFSSDNTGSFLLGCIVKIVHLNSSRSLYTEYSTVCRSAPSLWLQSSYHGNTFCSDVSNCAQVPYCKRGTVTSCWLQTQGYHNLDLRNVFYTPEDEWTALKH